MLRNTQHLVGIKATGDALMLEIMRFQNELVETSELTFPKPSNVRPEELRMVEQLVHNLAEGKTGKSSSRSVTRKKTAARTTTRAKKTA